MFRNGPKLVKISEGYLRGKKIKEDAPASVLKKSSNQQIYQYEYNLRTEFQSLLNTCPFFTVENPKGLIVEAKVVHSDLEHTLFDFDWKFYASIPTRNDNILEKGTIVKLLVKDTEMIEKFYQDPYITSCQAGVEFISVIQSPSNLPKPPLSLLTEHQEKLTLLQEGANEVELNAFDKNDNDSVKSVIDLETAREQFTFIDNEYHKKNKSQVEKILSNFYDTNNVEQINVQKMQKIFKEKTPRPLESNKKGALFLFFHFNISATNSSSISNDITSKKAIEEIMDYFEDDQKKFFK